jgi:hypothetical protein
MLGRPASTSIRGKLADVERRVEVKRGEADAAASTIEATEAELVNIARAEAREEITPDDAGSRREAAQARQRDARDIRADLERRLLPELEKLRDEVAADLEATVWREALAERDEVFGRELAEAKTFSGLLAKTLSSAKKLQTLRTEADASRARANELRPRGEEEPLPADEPAWPEGLDLLVDVIRAGARQPHARDETRREQAERQREHSEQLDIAGAVKADLQIPERLLGEDGFPSRVARLPAHLRPEAEKALERGRKEQRAKAGEARTSGRLGRV